MYLELKDVCRYYQQGESVVKALDHVSLGLEKGEFCVLLGQSGSGKSTLLNLIGGIDTMTSGQMKIGDHVIKDMDDHHLTQYRRDHIGYIFQQYHLIPDLNVRENIEVGAYLSEDPLDLEEVLDVLKIKDLQDHFPNELSGGQQQRTAIGRAMIKKPDLLLCDEPTGALDSKTSREILKFIEDVHDKYDTTIIMVTHNEKIQYMADRIIRILDGAIISDERNHHKRRVDAL